MGKAHKISHELKTDILKRVKEQGIPVSQAAKDHGVHESTIYNWLGTGVKGSPTWNEFNRLKKERDELLKIVGELTVKASSSQKKNW